MVRATRSGRVPPKRAEPVEDPASDSDDDAPVEISSKKQVSSGPDIVLAEAPEQDDGPTLYEQMRAKKSETETAKRVKRAEKKKVARKSKGVYEVKTKQTTFTVRTLGEGVSAPLQTTVSFREQLLAARTEGRREKYPEGMRQRQAFINRSK
ncbi:hypothetical protein PRIPAC_83337 [Pristionchus pacificus]|uniref:Uncharacterized protein n=1 Tax=Pristionchus pacificus TaxID=54126 RepID=A0A2A6BV94_PRIPA|nr:hypothetical protein PRIPAC_83337 [Pristionchus pacificus]|eukprot:PDM69713.1 hypothetical protein PRIPAC_44809 [Pristionchus pacificus]